MKSIINTLIGTGPTTSDDRTLLDSIRTTAIPDPAALRSHIDSLHAEIADAEHRWDALDAQGDAAAFVARTPLAERIQYLKAQAAPLPGQIALAERRRAAFLEAARLHAALEADVSARLHLLIERWPLDADERAVELEQLDQATRLRSRLAARLAGVSAAPQFREPLDAIKAMRDVLEARIRELDRYRLLGLRRPLGWPVPMQRLLDVVEDKERIAV